VLGLLKDLATQRSSFDSAYGQKLKGTRWHYEYLLQSQSSEIIVTEKERELFRQLFDDVIQALAAASITPDEIYRRLGTLQSHVGHTLPVKGATHE
jgi:hypothetical protein